MPAKRTPVVPSERGLRLSVYQPAYDQFDGRVTFTLGTEEGDGQAVAEPVVEAVTMVV
jgi:hypothetical protein